MSETSVDDHRLEQKGERESTDRQSEQDHPTQSRGGASAESEVPLFRSHTTSDIEKQEQGSDDSGSHEDRSMPPVEPLNPNIVTWEGLDDPAMPRNWTAGAKCGNIAVISAITFITPLASSMFAPGVPNVLQEFRSTNTELGSLAVSIYVLGYAFGPLILAPLSELYGRLIVYHVCNVLFVIFTVACAVSSNLNMLIGFRFLEGTFGAAALTIGGGTITDLIVPEKRGGVIAIWALGPLLGPVIGPVGGGYLNRAKGWRWVFWVITMIAGFITISAFIFLRETYAPTLLKRKAAKLRKQTGNKELRSILESHLAPGQFLKLSLVRPIKMLIFSPIILALSVFMAVVYGYLYLLFTTITEIFEEDYHFNSGSVGLTYLGIGVGSLVGVLIFGLFSDRISKAKAKTAGGEMKPEFRLYLMIPGSLPLPLGLFMYGWTADKHVQWIAPIIGTSLVGLGLIAALMPIQTYLVDAFEQHAASALAANTLLRSLIAALLPLAGPAMYAALGLGWGNSLLGFIALALCPIPWFLYKYGERIRKNPRFQVDL